MPTARTNFCCRSGGSNLNAGTRTGDTTVPGTAADFTYASGTWVSATGVFTVASGNPATDGVAVGDFASVYADGASVTTLVGRVTARDATTITVSTTAKTGTTSDGTSNRTLKIGGAFAGPAGASGFPFNFLTNACSNASGDLPQINVKNDATYTISAAISTVNADLAIGGFTTAYEDRGRFTLDGGTSGASYNLFGTSIGAQCRLFDCIMLNNGATGSAVGCFWNANAGVVERCVVHDVRGAGFQSNTMTRFIECEAYTCNVSNTANVGGFNTGGQGCEFIRCISHDNTGSNANGFHCASGTSFLDCIADSNGNIGFNFTTTGSVLNHCDAYNNGSHGIQLTTAANSGIYAENCNLVKNGGSGIAGAGAGVKSGRIVNCGFGAGTQANTGGTVTTMGGVEETGSVTYTDDATPWTDPANGDFRVSLAAAKAAGRGTFTQTAGSYAGTVAYNDIGAAQHQDAGGSGGNPNLLRGLAG